MTRKKNSNGAPDQKEFKPFVIDVTDDENFNWLHSRRTQEEKKRDEEISMLFKKRIEQLELEEEVLRAGTAIEVEPSPSS